MSKLLPTKSVSLLFLSLMILHLFTAPGTMRAAAACSEEAKAFGPYLLFQVSVTGYRFTAIPLDTDHYVILLYSTSGSVLGIHELCFDSQSGQSAGKAQMLSVLTASGTNAFGTAAQNAAVGDFNGDGVMDAAITVRGNTVAVYLANSDHSLRSPVIYTVGFGPSSAITADFNGDGKLDLAVTNIDSNNVSVLIGKGDGTFVPAVNYTTGPGPASAAVADFNGDGKLDLAVSDLGSFGTNLAGVTILLGNGDGTFKPAVNLLSPGLSPLALVSADFNGDGKADLAMANSSSTTVSVLLGTGSGTFQAAIKSNAGVGPQHLAYGDFNGDGKLDVAVIHRNTSVLSVLIGNGDGSFAAKVDYLAGAVPSTISAVDLHGDGKIDLLAGGGADYLSVIVGNGDGTLQAPPAYPVGGGPQSIAVADLNDDGLPDVVTANASSGDVSVLLGAGGPKFQAAIASAVGQGSSSHPPQPEDVVAADFNADGKVDVAVANQGSNDVAILLGKGDGTFQPPVHFRAGVNPGSLIAGDFNGDGKLDLAVANTDFNGTAGLGSVSILVGKGDGTFQAATKVDAGSHPVRVKAGDFNGDAKLDLAVANSGSSDAGSADGGVSILLGNGDGTFQPAKNYSAGSNLTALAVGDVNGDDELDLVVASRTPDLKYVLAVLLGKGDGTFHSAVNQPTVYGGQGIAIADINSDGEADLLVAHCCGATDMTYLLGKGDGTFQPEVHFPGGDSPTAVVVSDSNHDGLADLLITAGGAGGVGASTVSVTPNTFALPAIANVSAASFLFGPVATESIVTAFAPHLATGTNAAKTLPLPTELEGTTVKVRDSAGTERLAPLFYVSPGQVNYEVPEGTKIGLATVTITAGDNVSASAPLPIVNVAPGIFVLNSKSLIAANVTRVKPGKVQSVEKVYQIDPVTHQPVALPVDLDPPTDQIYLVIYATGVRGRGSLHDVTVTIGGANAKVLYAGPQGFFVGLDQINVLVPRSLKGRGNVGVVLTVEGKVASTARITLK